MTLIEVVEKIEKGMLFKCDCSCESGKTRYHELDCPVALWQKIRKAILVIDSVVNYR